MRRLGEPEAETECFSSSDEEKRNFAAFDFTDEDDDDEDESDAFESSSSTSDFEDELPLKRLKKRGKRKRKKFRKPKRPPLKRNSVSSAPPKQRVLDARKSLPYDFDDLVWDSAHQRNDKERYCYCGESGDWYKKMLQCRECRQWFHQECLRQSSAPILCGDRFFEFECCLCTGQDRETLNRLDLGWVDAVQLVLFHLTVANSKKYHDLDKTIMPFLTRKLSTLQVRTSIEHLKQLNLIKCFFRVRIRS